MQIIDGKKIAREIQAEIAAEISLLSTRQPCLAVILIGEHPASLLYVTRKAEACQEAGILSRKIELPSAITESQLVKEIEKLNSDNAVDGILVQMPLPSHIQQSVITEKIDPSKDVDGFHPTNVGKMLLGETDGFFSCTPLGIKTLLDKTGIAVTGKHVLVLGRSNIVGKPVAAMLLQNLPGANATVTIAHSRTPNIKQFTLMADILIAAMGKPKYVKGDMIKEGAVIIDVGINREENGTKKIVGDVDFESVSPKCSYITPVPGGVGPMTIAMLLSNTWKSYKRRMGL